MVASLGRPGLALPAWGGLLIGLASTARSVPSAFLPVLAAWRWWYAPERPRRWGPPVVIVLCAAAMIAPWIARNSILVGRLAPMDTTGYENFWYFNHFVGRRAFDEQLHAINSQPSMEQRQQLAVRFALKGIARDPWRLVDKSVDNFWHFLRPEGLHNLLAEGAVDRALAARVHRRPRGCVPGPGASRRSSSSSSPGGVRRPAP